MGKVADDHTSWAVAVEFHNAARVYLDYLVTKWPKEAIETFTGMPVNYLISHSLENVLKGYCYLNGDTKKDLMSRDLRHSLIALLDRAKGKGEKFSEGMNRLVAFLNDSHENFSNRYLQYDKGVKRVDYSECITLLYNEIGVFQAKRLERSKNDQN